MSYYQSVYCHICGQQVCQVCGCCHNPHCEHCSCPEIGKSVLRNKMEYYKKVAMPTIEVIIGNYCWGNGRICEYFTNEGGWTNCLLGFCPLNRDKKGRVLKPKECGDLKEVI